MSGHHTNPVNWIVCERTSRWASAIRMALAADELPQRIRELRHLGELDAELTERPAALVAIEVQRGNFSDLLAWLLRARERHPHAHSVVLLDRSLAETSADVCDVLIEAGAQAIATSPRRLEAIVACAARHAITARKTGENVSFTDQVWASLPWQAARSPLGWEARP